MTEYFVCADTRLCETAQEEGLVIINPVQPYNWLQVLYTAERSQVDQRIRHQLHPIVSLLDAFKAE